MVGVAGMWGKLWGVGDCLRLGFVGVAVGECWSEEGAMLWGLKW